MAIFHLSVNTISRGKGQCAVAMAAYRSGEKLEDERTGEKKFYQRNVQPQNHILAPANAPDWALDRNRLWNTVELFEKRKDARLGRHIDVALPVEFSREQQERVLKEYCQREFVDRGMVADIAIHRDDPENPHAHVMLTDRSLDPNGFAEKKNPEWNRKEMVESWREQWAVSVNQEFKRLDLPDRIDHRSLKDQGIDRLPTVHEGPTVRQMENRGVETDRGDMNRQVQEHNATVLYFNKYKREKEALQRNLQQHPEERRVLKEGERIIGQPVRMDTIQEGMNQLLEKEQGLRQQEQRLRDSMKPFVLGAQYFNQLEVWGADLKGSNGLSRLFDKESRVKHKLLDEKVSETKMKLLKLGFKDQEQFKDRENKVLDYNNQQMGNIRNEQHQIDLARSVLQHSEKLLERREIDTVVTQYPTWKEAPHLYYPEAKNINDLNKHMGRVMEPEQIQQSMQTMNQNDPVLGLLKGASDAFKEANRRVEQEQKQKEWQQQKKNRGQNRGR